MPKKKHVRENVTENLLRNAFTIQDIDEEEAPPAPTTDNFVFLNGDNFVFLNGDNFVFLES